MGLLAAPIARCASSAPLLMLPLRAIYRLHDVINQYHIDNMCKIILATGTMVGYAYATEFFIAAYSGNSFEKFAFVNRAFGQYAWAYWIMISCNVISPQSFWSRSAPVWGTRRTL